MIARTSTGNTLSDKVEQLKQEIAHATDFNKLVNDNEFLKKLKRLPQTEQLKIFVEYKDKFDKISKAPGSAIAKWTESLTKNFDIGQNNLDNEMQQGQQLFQDVRNSLELLSKKSAK